jgi:hypothetical protein
MTYPIPRQDFLTILDNACRESRLPADAQRAIYEANKDRTHVAYGTFVETSRGRQCRCPLTAAGYDAGSFPGIKGAIDPGPFRRRR